MMYNNGVAPNPGIADFVEKALAAGVPDRTLVGVLLARGWPEKDIYDALGEHYQRLTGIDIPRRAGAGASAKEAFFYLLIFFALATWTIGFGFLSFILIDRWLADPLFYDYQQAFDSYDTIATSLSALIVAYPLYLLVSRTVVQEAAAHPEKLDSPIRKWLTYMALVIASLVFTGDLISALTLLLHGELTSRFVAKSLVVLVLSGGVFYYYFGGLRRTDAASGELSRNRVMALSSAVMVAILIVLGLIQLGPPSAQRAYRADNQRVQQLLIFSAQVAGYWNNNSRQLPTAIAQLPVATAVDPITRAPYEYHPGQGSNYQLCATFSRGSDPREASSSTPSLWIHPAGHHCFSLDARAVVDFPPRYP